MAKPSNDIGDRDYGRRTYASNKKYEEQRKLASDAQIDRIARRKHSEYKKPYIPDQSYPEMEMYNIPWMPPVWPRIPPDDPTIVTPIDPGGPPVKPTPPREIPPFMGCMFFSRRLMPRRLRPGQIAIGGVDIGNQDSISAIHIYGPGILSTNIDGCNESNAVNISGYKPYQTNKGFCVITVTAKDDPRDFNHVTPYFTIGHDAPGPYPIVVEVVMASGAVCTENLEVDVCTDQSSDPVLDSAYNAETIGRNDQKLWRLIEPDETSEYGTAPFHWSISGTGFSLLAPVSKGRSNYILTNGNACGSGQVVVTDACGKTATGFIRCTFGAWVAVDRFCPEGFYGYKYDGLNDVGYWATKAKYRMRQSWAIVFSCGGGCGCGNCETNGYGPCSSLCDDVYSYGCMVCMDPSIQMGGCTGMDTFCDAVNPCEDGRFVYLSCFQCDVFDVEEWKCE